MNCNEWTLGEKGKTGRAVEKELMGPPPTLNRVQWCRYPLTAKGEVASCCWQRNVTVAVFRFECHSCLAPFESLASHNDWVDCVAFSPDSILLASGGFDNLIKLWDWQGNEESIATLEGRSASVICLRFSHNDNTLFSAGGDRTVKLWDLITDEEKLTLVGHRNPVKCLTFSQDGGVLTPCDAFGIKEYSKPDGSIRLWRAATKEEVEAPMGRGMPGG